ncbi:hypothetical protein RSAG8_13968, partial [Rhizoctonia solani AG-8 WAC10335]
LLSCLFYDLHLASMLTTPLSICYIGLRDQFAFMSSI